MCASFRSEGICPLFTRQREDEVFVEDGCRVICGTGDRTRQRRRPSSPLATRRLQMMLGKPPAACGRSFAVLCTVSGVDGEDMGARLTEHQKPNQQTTKRPRKTNGGEKKNQNPTKSSKGIVGGGGGRVDDRGNLSLHSNSIPKYKQHRWQRACQCASVSG